MNLNDLYIIIDWEVARRVVNLVKISWMESPSFQQNRRDFNDAIIEFLYLTRLPKFGI